MKPYFFGLLRRRLCPVPTLRGWLLLVLAGLAAGYFALTHVHPFLAVNRPVDGGALVIEGWAPDYAFAAAMAEFKRGHYDRLYVTGGPIELGVPLSAYRTYAEFGEALLLRMGMPRESVRAAPAPAVRKDRTYVSAVAMRDLLAREKCVPDRLNVISLGVHSRRSRLLFQKAFGGGTKIGIIAVKDENYDPAQWWTYSYGVRSVVDELIAYGYFRLVFTRERF